MMRPAGNWGRRLPARSNQIKQEALTTAEATTLCGPGVSVGCGQVPAVVELGRAPADVRGHRPSILDRAA